MSAQNSTGPSFALDPFVDRPRAPSRVCRFDVTIVSPTRNEAENVAALVDRIDAALAPTGILWEIVFADDSTDHTPDVIRELAACGRPVRLVHRVAENRYGGLSGALVEGFAVVDAPITAVIDADLQHPPEVLPRLLAPLLAGTVDVAVASRYIVGGTADGLVGPWRRFASRLSSSMCKTLFHEVRPVADSGSGFFAFRSDVISGVPLRPEGFKMLVELLVRGNWDRHVEVPYDFQGRLSGDSKVTWRLGVKFLEHLATLWVETRLDPQRVLWRRVSRRAASTVVADVPASAVVADVPAPACDDAVAASPVSVVVTANAARPRLKILLVASELPPVMSGVARTVDRVASELRARGHHVDTMSTRDRWYRHFGEYRVSGLGLHLLGSRGDLNQYDVINLHGPIPFVTDLTLAGWATFARPRRPGLVYTHHFDVAPNNRDAVSTFYGRLHNRLARSADHVIVTSPSYQRILAENGVNPVSIVPWGIDPSVGSPPRPPYAGDRELRVLFVGQQRPYKGVDRLIVAVSQCRSVRLTVFGGGALLEEHRALAARLAPSTIDVRGIATDDEIAEAFATHDVIVLPSVNRMEAFGIVLLEGMRAGCVPVASDLPGLGDVIGDAGIVVPPRRVSALRETLDALADDPESVQQLSKAARLRSELFRWSDTAARIEQVFYDVVR